MARQIRFFQSELEKREIPVARRGADPPTPDLDALESQLAGLETELTQLNANTDRLDRSYNELQELQLVLETAGTFFEDAHSNALQVRDEHALTAEGEWFNSCWEFQGSCLGDKLWQGRARCFSLV